jgi:hypothetical protein
MNLRRLAAAWLLAQGRSYGRAAGDESRLLTVKAGDLEERPRERASGW